jgi:uncharacterized protein (TIGR03083 family)
VTAPLLAHLDRARADFAAVLADGDLAAPVPGCAPWTLLDLAHHLGGVHRWAAGAVTGERVDKEADGPRDRAALVAWFTAGADALAATLAATDPATPCWTIAPPAVAGFWVRRQAHETALHAADAAMSQGAPADLPADLALDGVDEVVGTMFPRQVRLGRIPPLAVPLALEADEGGRWVLAGDGTGAPPASAPATVAGPAAVLQLLLWQRTTPADPRLVTTGDPAAARTVLAAALTP